MGEKYDLSKVENISCYEQSNDEIILSTRKQRGSRLTREECLKSGKVRSASRVSGLKVLEKRSWFWKEISTNLQIKEVLSTEERASP